MAVGMRPQWLSGSPLIEQLLSLGGRIGGQSMDEIRRELAGVDTVIIAIKPSGRQPLILARAADVVRTTKSERDAYRYVDPDTILVGDWNETNAAIGAVFADPVSEEARMAGRVAPWSDVWMILDPLAVPGTVTQISGVRKITIGMAMRDGLTVEGWLDTPSASVAKTLAAQLQKNPQGAQFLGRVGGASPVVEQRDNSVRLYVRVAASQPPRIGGLAGNGGSAARARPPGAQQGSRGTDGHVSRRGGSGAG